MSDVWRMSSSSDRAALDLVDGLGRWSGCGPHYSRRTPGSRTFTGIGQEVVLVSTDGAAVWAVVRQKTPSARGTGIGPGRSGVKDPRPRFVWRNMVFRRMPECRWSASDLISFATAVTYRTWLEKYGALPEERLRTEVAIGSVKSRNPGYCYKVAGYVKDRVVRGKLYLWAPLPPAPIEQVRALDIAPQRTAVRVDRAAVQLEMFARAA